jgi:DNA-binding transcriptional MerR regulator
VPTSPDLLSIGDLARASGIGVATLRAWETRYGKPAAERLPSGHRRYRPADVRWLRGMAEALARGHRPSQVVGLSRAALEALLAREVGEGDSPSHWVRLAKGYESRPLARALRSSWDQSGPITFFDDRLGPFLENLGRAWVEGKISIRHEHWVSQLVEDLLRVRRRALAARGTARGRAGLLATLPGEKHGLGLQMAAVVCAARKMRLRLLGQDTPIEEIAAAARESRARFVALSVSLASGGVETDRLLADLRALLPESVRLVVGGCGARGPRRGPRGVEYVASMKEFDAWLAALPR